MACRTYSTCTGKKRARYQFYRLCRFRILLPVTCCRPYRACRPPASPGTTAKGIRLQAVCRRLPPALMGHVQKVVIADTLAVVADNCFNDYTHLGAFPLIIGVLAFSFQIYGDFSGYSDIAIGTSKMFGFELLSNFKVPYFSRNIAEFWRRWHISLSSWFRDYLYIPLGDLRVVSGCRSEMCLSFSWSADSGMEPAGISSSGVSFMPAASFPYCWRTATVLMCRKWWRKTGCCRI